MLQSHPFLDQKSLPPTYPSNIVSKDQPAKQLNDAKRWGKKVLSYTYNIVHGRDNV